MPPLRGRLSPSSYRLSRTKCRLRVVQLRASQLSVAATGTVILIDIASRYYNYADQRTRQ